MPYSDLTEAEQTHWNEYTTLRALTDWPGFDADQDKRKRDARAWLIERRLHIGELALGHVPDQAAGWKVAKRQDRYEFLAPHNLNTGAPKHEVRLPAPASMTAPEKVHIEEREGYLAFGSQTPEQKARKQANVDWLVKRRGDLWHLMREDPDNNVALGRLERYNALCVATHHGMPYQKWDDTHNKWGVPTAPPEPTSGRKFCVQHAKSFIGVSENPAGSNSGHPQPSGWQERVYGADEVAWCACFTTCMAWDAGVEGKATASVNMNMEMARRGQGMYRGLTTDISKVGLADHVVIGCETCHIEVVADVPTPDYTDTVGGNTVPRPGSGNEYNGGTVSDRRRGRHEIVCYLLVRF